MGRSRFAVTSSVAMTKSIAIRTYANNTDDWLLGYVASEEIQDANGKRFKLTRNYYDGTAFQGLELGQVTRGDLTRVESWISGDSFANESGQPVRFGRQCHGQHQCARRAQRVRVRQRQSRLR